MEAAMIDTSYGQITRAPSRSILLILASQRIESILGDWFLNGESHTYFTYVSNDLTKRGAPPSLVEWLILSWVCGLIWSEVKQLWDVGLEEYAADMWNVIDFVTNSLYVATVALRVVAHFQVQKEMKLKMRTEDVPREEWDTWDPMLISEGLFSAANIFSSLKLVYIFSVNPYLGPLQVSLSRMVLDIMKFFFLYVLVLFAFSCGMNQLLWYYADMEKQRCPNATTSYDPKGVSDPDACIVWRRFSNLFETIQTLFWAVFGLVDLDNFELAGIKSFTRFWGMLMFGTYSVINIVVLLNLLIAMMNHSYQLISERADIEWKFARSRLWISYFEEGGTVPPPFNIIPTPKSLFYLIIWLQKRFYGHSRTAKKEHMRTIRSIMRNLVRRYVTVEQRKAENEGVTEDDVNEIKQDISAFRYELIEILRNAGMKITSSSATGTGAGGKKNRQKERRLMKGFNIAPTPASGTLGSQSGGSLPPDFISNFQNAGHHGLGPSHELFESLHSGLIGRSSGITMRRAYSSNAQNLMHLDTVHRSSGKYKKRTASRKKRWESLIEAAITGRVGRFMSKSRSEDSVCESRDNGASPISGSEPRRSRDYDYSDPTSERRDRTSNMPGEALAALRKKRENFASASKHLGHTGGYIAVPKPQETSKIHLKRAASVPVQSLDPTLCAGRLDQTQSVDSQSQMQSTLSPSTTDESVTAEAERLLIEPYNSSASGDLKTTLDSGGPIPPPPPPRDNIPTADKSYNGAYRPPNIPGVQPLSGHTNSEGWL